MVTAEYKESILEFSFEDIEDIFKESVGRVPTPEELEQIEVSIAIDQIWESAYSMLKKEVKEVISIKSPELTCG